MFHSLMEKPNIGLFVVLFFKFKDSTAYSAFTFSLILSILNIVLQILKGRLLHRSLLLLMIFEL